MFAVVNIKCIQLKDPTNIVTIIESKIHWIKDIVQTCHLTTNYTRSRITRTCLYQIITYFEGHLPHQKSLH